MTPLVASAPSAYWYTTRGAGMIALVLLTASVVLGVLDTNRWSSERWPRFMVDGLHRTISMLALAVVVVHVLTTVLDSFTGISLTDAVIPFASSYRPLWLGLGTLAFDLLLALAITSALRRRIGHGAWRAVHWAAYACWPLALLHGLGTGTDTPVAWTLALSAACLLAVLVAAGWRIATSGRGEPWQRGLAVSIGGASVLAIALWLAAGPLAANWASRSGTPSTLLASVGNGGTAAATGATQDASAPSFTVPFSARFSGTIRQRDFPGSGVVLIDMRGSLDGGATGTMEIQIEGQPVEDGGVAMTDGEASFGPAEAPLLYRGRITQLSGTQISARVSNGVDGATLDVNVSIDQTTQRVTGTATASAIGGTSGSASG